MNMKKPLSSSLRLPTFLLGLLLVCNSLDARVLRDFTFTEAKLPDELKFTIYGDKTSECDLATGIRGDEALHPALLFNPTDKSWGFLICDIPANEIPSGGIVRATAFLTSNRLNQNFLYISEGETVGGTCNKLSCITGKGVAGSRVVLTTKLPRRAANEFVSIAVGLDYHSEGTWSAVDRLVVEHLADGEKSTLEPPASLEPLRQLKLPKGGFLTALIRQTAPTLEAIGRERRRYEAAGLATHPAAQQRLKASENLAAILRGEFDFSRMPETETLLKETAFRWQTLPEMTVLDDTTVLPPVVTERLATVAPANSRTGKVLMFTNDYPKTVTCQVFVEGEGASAVTMRRLHWMDGVADIPIDYTPGELLEIGPGESVPFMLEFSAKKLKPGPHPIRMRLVPLELQLPERTLECSFKVLPYRLPDTLPVPTYVWDYNMASDDNVMRLLRDLRVNTFQVTLHSLDSFKGLHDTINAIDRHGIRDSSTLIVEVWFVREAKRWKPEFDKWLDRLVAEMKACSWPQDRWYLQIYDETFRDEYYQVAKALKAKHPNVRLFCDSIADIDTIAKFAPLVDYWCPHLRHCTKFREQFGESLKLMHKTHPTGIYECDSFAHWPLEHYRFIAWLAWLDDAKGITFWSIINLTLRPEPAKRNNNVGMTYVINGRRIPSRRWRIFAAGLEDYLLLLRASELAPEKTRKLAEQVQAAFQKTEFPTVIEETRAALLEIIESTSAK